MSKNITQSADLDELGNSPERLAKPCGCGHSRGNHRWFALGGKHPCLEYANDTKCDCEAFHEK